MFHQKEYVILLFTFQFLQKQSTEEKVYFQLESSINCGWLRWLGEPKDKQVANVNIYFAGKVSISPVSVFVDMVHLPTN